MRKLVLILIAFFAVVTFIRTFAEAENSKVSVTADTAEFVEAIDG